jgi:uncharacterized membrane protein
MQKNGQYVGVEENYIPEDEKYVENNLNSEIKNDLNNIYKGAKDYVSNEDNKETMKKAGKTGLKIIKGIGIGYLCGIVLIIIIVIVTIIMIYKTFFDMRSNINNKANEINNTTNEIINSSYSQYEITSFNSNLEIYNGTEYGTQVESLLDNVNTKIKKETNHSITVVYGNISTSNTTEISNIKKQLKTTSKYEVSFDYDSDGFINKVTITDY